MLEKEVKQYKRGNSFTYRIDLSKKDEFEGGEKIMILRIEEYESIIKEIEDLKLQIEDNNNLISKLKENRSSANSTLTELKEEHLAQIDAKNDKIMELVNQNKNDVQNFIEEIRIEREKTDNAKLKAQEDLDKERLRYDDVVKELMEKNNLLTAYRLLIERYKSMSFLDRLLNRLPNESDLKPADAIETYAVIDSVDTEKDD
ncbi:MAG: hypothetical protein Q4P14_04115 [Methanobacteriaceae archaeon]|nr:hypothetical protein [Methanobacteriaceae archaeon]